MGEVYEPAIRVTGEGPAVVLVPGMDGTGLLFYRQVAKLARRYRVAAYALRDTARTMAVLVEDLARVIEQIAPDSRRAIVIGESFGGALALTLAAERPERVAALAIVNSFPYFAPQLRLLLASAALHTMPWGMMGAVRRLTASRLHSAHTDPAEIRRFLALTATASRVGYLNRLHILRSWDVRDALGGIAAPTLFVAADADRLVPAVEQARLMASRVPRSTLRVLEGHGHICLIAPDVDLARLLDEWHTVA